MVPAARGTAGTYTKQFKRIMKGSVCKRAPCFRHKRSCLHKKVKLAVGGSPCTEWIDGGTAHGNC
eukprot:4106148-Alexandrium_andersonii.AAC.1